MIWHSPLLCVGSCAGQETCSRAWRKNHHSSPGLHLRPGPSIGKGEQELQTAHRVITRKRKQSKVSVEINNQDRHARIELKQ